MGSQNRTAVPATDRAGSIDEKVQTPVRPGSSRFATYTLPFPVSATDYENFEVTVHSFVTSNIVSSGVVPIDC